MHTLNVCFNIPDSPSSRTAIGTKLVMLICRVLLGNAFECREPQQFQRPPCETCQNVRCVKHEKFYDSVIGLNRSGGEPLLFREFIVYERFQAYPEYIVHYERK